MSRRRDAAVLLVRALVLAAALVLLTRATGARGDRRNLTPGQLDLAMGRHYNHAKLPPTEKGEPRVSGHRQNDGDTHGTAGRIAKEYGVSVSTIERAGRLAAAVETLKAVDPSATSTGYHAAPDEWRPTPSAPWNVYDSP